MRYQSKQQLLDDIRSEHDRLAVELQRIRPSRWREPGVWGDRWTVNDLVAHLAEWHRLFLGWHTQGLEGRTPVMPAPGYKWNETSKLNRAIQARHAGRSRASVLSDFEAGYRDIFELAGRLSDRQLLSAGHFDWTRKYPLTTYLGANTASHYRFALKVLARWKRSLTSPSASRPRAERSPRASSARRSGRA